MAFVLTGLVTLAVVTATLADNPAAHLRDHATLISDSHDEEAAERLIKEAGGETRRDKYLIGRPVVWACLTRPDPDAVTALAKLPCLETVACLHWPPERVRELAPLRQLHVLHVSGTTIAVKDIEALGAVRHLRALHLVSCRGVTDEVVATAKGLPELERLDLYGCDEVTGVGLGALRALPYLRSLELSRTAVADAGLKVVAGLSNLESVDFTACKVTDVGLKKLASLNRLAVVRLEHNDKITKVGLKALGQLPRLRELSLRCCDGLNDEGLRELTGETNLEVLDLSDCQNVTDAGLNELTKFRQLRRLNLSGCTKLTQKAVEDLKAALPECKVEAR
jgi:hypothetical protein